MGASHVANEQTLIVFLVIATKYTTNFRAGYGETEIMANFGGNGTKSMRTSVEASLKKLQTDYIDLVRSSASKHHTQTC